VPLDLDINRYLARLGVPHTGPPSVEGLYALHQAHVERVPYENLDIQLGRRTSIGAVDSALRITAGAGGYCYHLNGAFALLLASLGYAVRRHRGGVQARGEARPPGANGNHLALTVHGLPSRDNPDGMWFVDVGLGDALHGPLPLRVGEYTDGPLRFGLAPSTVEYLGWRFTHDPVGSFAGMDFRADLASEREFASRHEWLSSDPASPFLRLVTVQRRDKSGVDSLRGRVLRRLPEGHGRELGTAAEWYGVLADVFGLHLRELARDEREGLWRRVNATHDAWQVARGAP
jgi:N-hydroxyarylamine O-acetyltransferase